MEINVESRHGFNLIVEADNVKIIEDIEERVYLKDDNGNTKYTCPERDIKDEYLDKISEVLDDMIWYRVKPYDSSNLIQNLIEKLPEEGQVELLKKLKECYDITGIEG